MPATGEQKSRISCCAIVVTHYPEMPALLKLLSQLNKETDFLVIDNGSPEAGRFRDSVLAYHHCIDYWQLEHNVGLAEALNRGLQELRRRNYSFAFLFDQDSSLCDLYIQSMLAAYQQASAISRRRVAAIGPRIINPRTHRQTPFKLFNRLFWRSDRPFFGDSRLFRADFLITSGTLLPLAWLDDIGDMKASYFIDNVDLEWCFRARAKGYALAGTSQAVLYHSIGEYSASPLVRKGLIAWHKPERTYYSSRNRVHLYGQSYSPWGWKLRDLPRFLLKSLWLLLASDERRAYWQNIRAGIRDARSLG
ncbi:MAG: glycosyltransferase family 2 protein [Gammaproteobacteria bacterium]|nr:glycosyltransferase family 2 protein [Pseudomonadales bacterium]MCP5347525.1 glycosyltransferase family 2 protein [Pseudomonadales bacterium]